MTHVQYQHSVELLNSTGSRVNLFDGKSVISAVVSYDVDRAPYVAAQVVLKGDQRTRADGRTGARLRLRILQVDATGAIRSRFPASTGYGAIGYDHSDLRIQDTDYDVLADETTIVAVGAEQRLMDKIRLAGTTVNTAATTALALANWSLSDVLGTTPVVTDRGAVAAGAAIPAGDRRLMQPEESHWSNLETELSVVNVRLYADAGGNWAIARRDDPPRNTADGPFFGSTLDGDPSSKIIVTRIISRIRRGDWYDGILAKYTYINGAGTSTTSYQQSGGGANTRGRVVQINRTPPAGNNAQAIANRYGLRGSAFDITAQIHFGLVPGASFTIGGRPSGLIDPGAIQAVEWDTGSGEMTIRSRLGLTP